MATRHEAVLRLATRSLAAPALILTLALTSPGVTIARASDGVTELDSTAQVSVDPLLEARLAGVRPPTCSAPAASDIPEEAVAETLQRMLDREAERLRALHGPDASDSDHIVMNGRGYNYARAHGPRN